MSVPSVFVLLAPFLVLAATGCSRNTDAPIRRASQEPTRGAAPLVSVRDATPTPSTPPPVSPFTIVARAATPIPLESRRAVGTALPLVQRLPTGGLVVASEYARAHADGPGALSVDLIAGGMEAYVLYRPPVALGQEGLRWVWSDGALSVAVAENETARTGPRLESYKVDASGFKTLRRGVGYWSAAQRNGSVLALERTSYEVPNSSIYAKGSGHAQNEWRLPPARIAVLEGTASPPLIPPGVCPTSMSAAPDGTLVVTIEACLASSEHKVGVLRYAPSAVHAKEEWFPPQSTRGTSPDDVVSFAASESELYVADGARLRTWDGKGWSTSEPFPNEKLASVSRAPGGELWIVAEGRVAKRSVDKKTWSQVPLPSAPRDPLDEEPYTPPFEVQHFQRVQALPDDLAVRRASVRGAISAMSVDATADEVLVLGVVDNEAFVLSTRPRAPVARLPSIPTQRARLAQRMKRRVATSPKDCARTSFLIFAETTTIDALRAAMSGGDAGAGDGGVGAATIGEGVVEGQRRFFVHGEEAGVFSAAKRLAALGPKRLCGPAVVDRDL